MRFTVELNTSSLVAALAALGSKAESRLKSAAKRTAERVRNEAQRRVRQATGQTRAGIYAAEDYTKTGYVVATADSRLDAGQMVRGGRRGTLRRAPRFKKGLHVGTYLEYGTVKMTAKPFFYVSATLEESAHRRRIAEAVSDAIADAGLGR